METRASTRQRRDEAMAQEQSNLKSQLLAHAKVRGVACGAPPASCCSCG